MSSDSTLYSDANAAAAASGGEPSRFSRRAVVGLGGNLGDRLDYLQTAVDALGGTPGVWIIAVSPVYETEPFGPPDQPDYLNAVVIIETSLSPRLLLERAQAIEESCRRVRAEHWGPRVIDVDIITYQNEISADEKLTLPHPYAHTRPTVLAPWHDVEPTAVLPGHGLVADVLARLDTTPVRRRNDLKLRPPE